MQGIKAKLDDHRRTTTMFQQVVQYNVQMKNILFRPSDIEIKNKQIIKEKIDLFRIYKGLWRRSINSKQNCKIGTMRIIKYW
jgi:hypothetical protein